MPGATKPVWSYGLDGAATKTPVFTCPVSAIPVHVWALYALWQDCQALGTLPKPGGLLDQPVAYREAASIFARLQRAADRVAALHGQMAGTLTAIGAAFGGGKRR